MVIPRQRIMAHARLMLLAMSCVSLGVAVETKDRAPSGGWVTSFQDLAYPASALANKTQGVVVIRATLDSGGNLLAVSALSGSRLLVAACLANASRWKFLPNPDKMGIIVFDFEIEDGKCHDAARSLFRFLPPNLALITACTQTE
jgi:TonB family protein